MIIDPDMAHTPAEIAHALRLSEANVLKIIQRANKKASKNGQLREVLREYVRAKSRSGDYTITVDTSVKMGDLFD
jgi:hypothetical protein